MRLGGGWAKVPADKQWHRTVIDERAWGPTIAYACGAVHPIIELCIPSTPPDDKLDKCVVCGFATTVLKSSAAARIEQVMDLYAPKDEDGIRHPEDGLISEEDARKLLDFPDLENA